MTTPQETVDMQAVILEYRNRLAQETEKNIVLECRLKARDARISVLEEELSAHN